MTSDSLSTPKTKTVKLISKGVNSTRFPLVDPNTGTYIDVNLFHFTGQETISITWTSYAITSIAIFQTL